MSKWIFQRGLATDEPIILPRPAVSARSVPSTSAMVKGTSRMRASRN
jgi:hypothetical protein